MKTTIITIIAIGLFIYSLKISISFSPFKISCEQPYLSFGCLFVLLGFSLMMTHHNKNGYNKGYIKGINDAKKIVTEEFNKRPNENK